MWLYPRPSCPDHPSFKELSAAEINARIHKVLDLGANPNPQASPSPLQEGVASTRVSMFGLLSTAYTILSFHHAHGLAQGLRSACRELRDASLPKDTVR
jgi:hypothetical protein